MASSQVVTIRPNELVWTPGILLGSVTTCHKSNSWIVRTTVAKCVSQRRFAAAYYGGIEEAKYQADLYHRTYCIQNRLHVNDFASVDCDCGRRIVVRLGGVDSTAYMIVEPEDWNILRLYRWCRGGVWGRQRPQTKLRIPSEKYAKYETVTPQQLMRKFDSIPRLATSKPNLYVLEKGSTQYTMDCS